MTVWSGVPGDMVTVSRCGAWQTSIRPGPSQALVNRAVDRVAGGRPIPGNKVELLFDGPAVYPAMLDRIAEVYHRYGFDPLETSAVETVEALGKFLPDVDRPNEGVFGWQDEDADWLALRYDLTAPLARVAAQYRNDLPSPYRRYAMGPVWRNEKPGPGRFRQFYQCDADTVGSGSVAAAPKRRR